MPRFGEKLLNSENFSLLAKQKLKSVAVLDYMSEREVHRTY